MKKITLFLVSAFASTLLSALYAQIPNDYVAFYEFTNNSNANSAAGNTYPLTNIDVACQYTDRFNNANSAYTPNCGNENNGYRLTANSQLITDYSISFWYKSNVTNNTTNRQIIAFKEANSTNDFAFSFRRINNLYYVFVNYGGITVNANLYSTTNNLLNDGNWHNIVLSIDGFAVNSLPNGQNINQYDTTLYVDNVLHTSASSTLDAIDNNDPYYGTHGLPTLELIIAPIVLNHQNGGNVADSIDDILVYDRTISQSEVNNIYNATSSTCTNIVNIPDANFKAALLAHGTTITGTTVSVIDTDGDGEICQSEAQAYTRSIAVHNKSISDLTGIEAFTALTKLFCNNNQLTSLDVSANTALIRLNCENNQLTSLNVANGNNSNMVGMQAMINTNLTCIQTDANIVGTNPSGWQKDATASYSANCSTSCTNIVNIPDANFKAALLDHGVGITGTNISVIDTDGDGEICQTEAQAYTGKINVAGKSINNLTGIEYFTSLTILECGYNNLVSLDLTSNVALNTLKCNNNQLSSLNTNVALGFLQCNNNNITTLDLSNHTNLGIIYISFNQLTDAGLSLPTTNSKLTDFDVRNNQLTAIDVSVYTALERLYCSNNRISSLDVSSNSALIDLKCKDNQLTALNVANGNNDAIINGYVTQTIVTATNNPNLNCIQHDSGYNPANNQYWRKDTTAIWSDNCAAASINDVTFSNAVTVYPNPTSSTLYISANNTQINTIEIYNVLGKKVLTTQQEEVSVSKLPSGMYILKIQNTEGNIATKKFIKQ